MQTIAIAITSDIVAEPNETFSAVPTDAHGATLAHAIGVATIVDDDAVLFLAISPPDPII